MFMFVDRIAACCAQAQNMIDYREDIAARPVRTWFQTAQQKKATAAAAKPGSETEKQKFKSQAAEKREHIRLRKRAKEPEDTSHELKVSWLPPGQWLLGCVRKSCRWHGCDTRAL